MAPTFRRPQGVLSNYTNLLIEPPGHTIGGSRGIEPVIPEKSDHIANRKRLGSQGGRPPEFDTEAYKRRNAIKQRFGAFKQWRAIATRYEKLAVNYRGGVVLRAITIWRSICVLGGQRY